ncbi:unnamed protein product [Meloidogyne enterolobii]|uniref:Uncharacterized protein n=1 Tax=Meloidogyne enterolobii TaxID=390850 RepID=A0ACB0Z4B2_MELEN
MTRKKSNKIASNNNNSDRPTKNIIKNNNNTIEAAFKRIQNTRQCPKCNKKVDYSVYLQHYEKCKNREEEEVEEDDDDIIFCGEGQGHKENEQEASEFNNSKKNLKRTDKSSVVVNVEDDDSQSNLESPRSSALNSGIVSRDVIDGNVRRAPASPITICDDSSNEVPITVFKPKNYCSDLPLAQIYDLCVERLEDFLSEQEELLRNLPPPKCK